MVKKGVVGFKCFLIHSGVDEFPSVTEAEVDTALTELKGTGSVLAVNHNGHYYGKNVFLRNNIVFICM